MTQPVEPRKRISFLGVPFDPLTPEEALVRIRSQARTDAPFRYVVTPNAAHVAHHDRYKAQLGPVYRRSWLSLCDSRIVAALARMSALGLPVVTGSDIVAALLAGGCLANSTVTIIGSDAGSVACISARFRIGKIAHHAPPFGFIDDAVAFQKCVDVVAAARSDYVLLAVGAPQSELLAHHLARTGLARGVGLCIGAALDFAASRKPRAPSWMRRAGLEWWFRLSTEPRRLWRRYLVRSPRVFRLYLRERFAPESRVGGLEPGRWIERMAEDAR
jgi:exopolysaccharide biosynthesis WecB/TagA/CpsF family protein